MPVNSIIQNLIRLSTARDQIASAIVTKNGTVNTGDGFEEFPADIATIPSGGNSNDFLLPKPNPRPRFSNTWSKKTWTGLTSINGQYIWTDGNNIYYSNGGNQYVLNKETSTWSSKTWTGLTPYGYYIWTDGNNIYYSNGSNQYVLNKTADTYPTTKCAPGYIV